MTDPISDMLTRIRNASAVKKDEVVLPTSKIKFNIAKLLEKDGWVNKAEIIEASAQKDKTNSFNMLRIVLKYNEKGQSAISSLKRISKPGNRVYSPKTDLPRVLNNAGVAVLSTSQGIMTNKEARKRGIGGEIICEIY